MKPIAIVTGANRGLGKEVSRQLAAQDYLVILTSRSLQKAQDTAKELGFENIVPAELDVADPSSIERLNERVTAEFGRVDVLVNNAAIHYDTWQKAINADLEVVQEALDTNVYGPWRMVQTFLPLLRNSSHPRIVNVSSGGGALHGMSGGTPAYSVSKASLNALTLMWADELRGDHILVNAVCPGWVATDMGGLGGRPVKDGAEGIVWAATLPDNGPTGGFFRDGKPIEW
ncbi:SDR family oxidoreductase [Vibrio sp. JC009]|uniref:SDR family oxidoreductase n=1 Tax=Vibrio sp. JC009 TaxID=2912314 RepID=UPI0023AF72B0|nr:SDR family oxidoreductase [Vibrio sp. JC009]WED23432.1 SDR family oxidoreductase [Vibrio sp. JC009]